MGFRCRKNIEADSRCKAVIRAVHVDFDWYKPSVIQETPIRPNYDSLLQYLGKIAQDDLTDVLLHLSEYRVKSVAQDESRVVPARKFAKQAGEINWENQSSVEIERLYRAIGSKVIMRYTFSRLGGSYTWKYVRWFRFRYKPL